MYEALIERETPSAVLLEPEEAHDRDEMADVERRPGRVESVVAGDRLADCDANDYRSLTGCTW